MVGVRIGAPDHLQPRDVADGVVLVRAVAFDSRVHVWVIVDVRGVRGRAGARVDAAEPRWPHSAPDFVKHPLQRIRCK